MILLDSNILVDLRNRDDRWSDWARECLSSVDEDEEVCVSPVVLAETVRHFTSARDQVETLRTMGIAVTPLSAEGAWLAGQAHQAYRRAGGPRTAVLADFLIGGHAASLKATLMTRDRQRFAAYFPTLLLLTPEANA